MQTKTQIKENKNPIMIKASKVHQHQWFKHFIHLTFQTVNKSTLNSTIRHQNRCNP